MCNRVLRFVRVASNSRKELRAWIAVLSRLTFHRIMVQKKYNMKNDKPWNLCVADNSERIRLRHICKTYKTDKMHWIWKILRCFLDFIATKRCIVGLNAKGMQFRNWHGISRSFKMGRNSVVNIVRISGEWRENVQINRWWDWFMRQSRDKIFVEIFLLFIK